MDRGFNDDELADIMSEIESLEQEFTDEVEGKKEEVQAKMSEPESVEDFDENVEDSEDNVETITAEQNEPEMEDFTDSEEEVAEVVHAKAEPVEQAEPVEHVEHVEHVEPAVAVAPVEEFSPEEESVASHQETHHEVLEQVAAKPVEEVVQPVQSHDDHVHQLKPQTDHSFHEATGAQTSMSFRVEGDMKLDLAFNISGKEVHLSVNEHGLEIGLEGGAKFSVPLHTTFKKDKAA